MKKEDKCKNCEHWKNHQSALNYWESIGFCINDKFRFNVQQGRLIGVFDTMNAKSRDEVTGNCSHDIETVSEYPAKVQQSRYRLVTQEDFGCAFHEQKK